MAGHVKVPLDVVEYKFGRADPEGAVSQFFTDVMTEIRRNRVAHALSDSYKVLISHLIPMLQTAIVRDTIDREYAYWPKD